MLALKLGVDYWTLAQQPAGFLRKVETYLEAQEIAAEVIKRRGAKWPTDA